MCKFFSFLSNGRGKYYYLNWGQRRALFINNPHNYEPDSHTSIADYFKKNEDKLNKFEYNPLLDNFQIDQINTKNDSKNVENWVRKLDFKTIIDPLIIKSIINPFEITPKLRKNEIVFKKDIQLLKNWASVRASVRDSVRDSVWDSAWDSVWDSVRDSVRDSVWDSVRASVRDSVWASVRDSVRASVWDSVRDSVRASVWASVWAYISSFFDIKYKYNFKPLIDLWERGFVPSFDGKIWRLHCYKNAKIVYEYKR